MKERINKKELINIIIVYAIVLAIMIVASAITSTLSDKGVNIPVVLKMLLIYGLLLIPPVVYTKKKGDSFVETLSDTFFLSLFCLTSAFNKYLVVSESIRASNSSNI